MRGVLSGFGCDFDMQDAVVDGEAHKYNPCNQVLVNARTPGEIERRYQGRNQLRRGHQPGGSPLSCESTRDAGEAGGIAFRWHTPLLGMLNRLNISTHKHSIKNGSMGHFPSTKRRLIHVDCGPYTLSHAPPHCWQ